jgi:hypothetical protein
MKEGSGSAPGCDGVTARGECQSGAAVYCDIERGMLRRVDCAALGESCVLDTVRGAVCEDISTRSVAETPCDSGVSETGFCSDNTAVYCDTSGDEPVTRVWDCGASDMACVVDGCADGAYCCGDGSQQECGSLDFNGTCDGNVARWCGALGPKELDCSSLGQTCAVDECAQGAYCCGEPETPDECAEIGWAGVCEGDSMKFCFDGEIIETQCNAGETCQVDACQSGAACCETDSNPDECAEIGWEGVCEGNTMRFCTGGEILDVDCGERQCAEDVCGSGALCCQNVCESIDSVGTCAGNTLQYCLGDDFSAIDCSALGKTCEFDTCVPGISECC